MEKNIFQIIWNKEIRDSPKKKRFWMDFHALQPNQGTADIRQGKRGISQWDWSLEMPIVRAATDCRIHLRMTTIVGVCTWPGPSRALMQRVLSVKTEARWRSSQTTVLSWIYIVTTVLIWGTYTTRPRFSAMSVSTRCNRYRHDILEMFLIETVVIIIDDPCRKIKSPIWVKLSKLINLSEQFFDYFDDRLNFIETFELSIANGIQIRI